MSFYAEDGHPLNINRAHGFIADAEGIVICGECACKGAMTRYNGWDTSKSVAILKWAGYLPYDATEGDDWCSDCDRDLVPRATLADLGRAIADLEAIQSEHGLR